MSEQQTTVQGMYCLLKGDGTQRCTVTMSDVSLTVYTESPLFTFGENDIAKNFRTLAQHAGTNISREVYEQDFKDLLLLTSKIQRTQMSLRSGDKIITYALDGNIVQDEKSKILHLSPEREEWWSHPKLEPVVASIKSYLPDFLPWLMQKDKYISLLSRKSGLL